MAMEDKPYPEYSLLLAVQTCFVVKMSYNNSQSQYGYGNYPAGYPSEHSGYGYGGQASTPGSIPGFPTSVAAQPAPVTATQTYGQYREARRSAAQSAVQSADRAADQADQLLGLVAAAARPARPGSYPRPAQPGYPTSNQGDQNQRPDRDDVPYKPGEGDWECNICKKLNFRKRTECFGCCLPRDRELDFQQDNRRDGDWNCLKCGANNISRRTFCFKPECKAPKPREERGSYRGDRRDSGGPHPGDQRQFGQAQPPQSTVNYSGYSGQNTNYPSPTQSSRPGGQIIKRSANDNYRASLASGRNSGGNSNNAPLGSVENRGQKRSLGSGESNYRSGKGSSRSFGDDFGPRKPRFSSYENWGKDDDLIKVEPTLIDKKFNFWNLPKSARILLVSNVPPEIAKPNPIFHLFSFYGDVVRVKILPHKTPDVALVEFETATQACIARNHLDQVQMKDHKLVVSFSRFGEIRASPGDEGLMEEFTGPDFDILHRFSKEDLSIVNLKRISGPRNCLHINNIPQGTNLDQVKALFENKGVPVQDMIAIKKQKSSGKIKQSAAVVFIQVANTSDALIAMALVGGSMASKDIPAGLRVSFTESNISAERKKS